MTIDPKRRARKSARLALAALPILACACATAQPAPAAPPPCMAPEYRQFDFWVGEWDVYLPNGQKAGENRIEPIAGGCALLENWAGKGGFSGKSLNIYDSGDQRWHQTWVDNSGTLLMISGSFVAGRMVLGSEAPNRGGAGGTTRQQISWTPGDDGSVRQLWESSTDSGKTWTVLFDGKYVKRK
ncbi:MAG: hypothetical protein ABJA61_05325 [Caldimonas sp.]